MSTLPLSRFVICYANLQRKYLSTCPETYKTAERIPRPLASRIKIDNGGTSLHFKANVLSAIRKLTGISKFLSSYETKSTQNDVKRCFTT